MHGDFCEVMKMEYADTAKTREMELREQVRAPSWGGRAALRSNRCGSAAARLQETLQERGLWEAPRASSPRSE